MSDKRKPTLDRRKVLQALGIAGVGGMPAVSPATAASSSLKPTETNTIAYRKLSAEAKREFEKALKGKEFHARGSAPDAFYEYPFVEYDADVYETRFLISYEHKNEIDPTAIGKGDVPENADVLEHGEMSSKQQAVFDRALSECGYTSPGNEPEWVFSFEDRFVKKGQKHYRLNFKHADVVTYTLDPKKVE